MNFQNVLNHTFIILLLFSLTLVLVSCIQQNMETSQIKLNESSDGSSIESLENTDLPVIPLQSGSEEEKTEQINPPQSSDRYDEVSNDDYHLSDDLQCDGTTPELCELAKARGSIRNCIKSENIWYQYYCTAMVTHNLSYCDAIVTESERVFCSCFISKNPQLCNQLSGSQKDWCYTEYGFNTGDINACHEISESNTRNSCIAQANQDIELCLSLDEFSKFQCITAIGHATNNVTMCKYVDDYETCMESII
jgi:hypothetical protein